MIGLWTYFKKVNAGHVFFPFGVLGSSFIVDESKKYAIQEFKKIYMGVLSVLLLLQLSTRDPYIFGLNITSAFFVGVILRIIVTRLLVLNSQKSMEKLTLEKRKQILFDQDKKDSFLVVMLSSIVLFSLSIYLLIEFGFGGTFSLVISILSTIYYLLLTDDLRRVKGRVDNWLDRYFPEFSTVFKNWDGKAALLTLKSFPLPKEILGHSEEEIVSCWKQEVNRAVGKKRAKKLKEAAQNSTGLTEGEIMARQELKTLLSQYDALIEELEQVLVQIENILKEIPGAEEMMSIPGVGMVTVAGFLAEVGDLSNYQHPNQIKKLAGLNLKENSSGKHKGETKITKRGRPRLRGLLYRCVIPLVAKNPEFKLLHDYYTTRPENPLKKKQSLVALACRLIRVLFALGTKKTPYNGRMMLKNSSLNLLQDAA
ncbi:IS110 family transposase [Natranaerobius thermophilus]|uniref:Transposase IS116/IS110/IS902 family protein n=1 Tax=Natranaerobius thermophilus (strain ATCC BAA-1301 / DSM 18059 / JW/NM-WN-LF) TaxID=457570 RepID=B2A4U2_NATTJ|nr:IS110 family transposase [Natranaerobius thermophilus]ACB83864.1 transposase IS116/IS110/IS902 family protein [Natranaerobius thermophilus JW/NM-WN-LF]